MPSPALPIPPSSVSVLDTAAISSLVREEVDRNNRYLEFAQGQIEKDRSFYKHLYGFATGFIVFIVGLAGFFQYTSVSQMRTDMKASVDAEMEHGKAEIAILRAQAIQASADAQATVTRELASVRAEVQKRIDTEFKSENITSLVSKTAKERTDTELAGVIRSETSIQVANGIKEQGPTIQKAVEDQTKESVKALQPTIKASVDNATQEQVQRAVAPIMVQMDAYSSLLHVWKLATLAKNDNRHAFDTLFQIALGKRPQSNNPELLQVANETVEVVIADEDRELGVRLVRDFVKPQTPESMKLFMQDPDPLTRQTALDHYSKDDKSVLPILVKMLNDEPSIRVLARAAEMFNILTKQSFRWWQTTEMLNWWEKNRQSLQ